MHGLKIKHMNQCVIKQNKNDIATSGDLSLSGNIRILSDAGSSACHRAHIEYWSDWADVRAQANLSSLCAFLLRLSREKSLKLSYIRKCEATCSIGHTFFGVNQTLTDVFFSYEHVH